MSPPCVNSSSHIPVRYCDCDIFSKLVEDQEQRKSTYIQNQFLISYSKQLTGEATTTAKNYFDGSTVFFILKRISSYARSCITDLLAGSPSTTNKSYLKFKISKAKDSWKKWHTPHNTA